MYESTIRSPIWTKFHFHGVIHGQCHILINPCHPPKIRIKNNLKSQVMLHPVLANSTSYTQGHRRSWAAFTLHMKSGVSHINGVWNYPHSSPISQFWHKAGSAITGRIPRCAYMMYYRWSADRSRLVLFMDGIINGRPEVPTCVRAYFWRVPHTHSSHISAGILCFNP